MADSVLRLPEVKSRTGLSRASIYNRIAARDFPQPIQLGGSDSRAIGFLESEIEAWLANRPRGVRAPAVPGPENQAA